MKNKEKSNRAQADYFELLVCQYICHIYHVTFSYSKDLAELSNKTLALPDGLNRLKLQNDNFIKIQPKLIEILNYEIGKKGIVVGVTWVGRDLLIETTSDVDAEHISNKKTRFSIKSVAGSNKGTLKNIGSRKLKKFLGVDFSINYNKMWSEIRKHIDNYSQSMSKIKEKIQNDDELLKWARDNGAKYQSLLNTSCINAFNSISLEEKINFINYVSDCEDKDLYVIIVNSYGVIIYKPYDEKVNLIKDIEAVNGTNSNVGYTILINKNPIYRVQTNSTNGIGISPFCQRIFLI